VNETYERTVLPCVENIEISEPPRKRIDLDPESSRFGIGSSPTSTLTVMFSPQNGGFWGVMFSPQNGGFLQLFGGKFQNFKNRGVFRENKKKYWSNYRCQNSLFLLFWSSDSGDEKYLVEKDIF